MTCEARVQVYDKARSKKIQAIFTKHAPAAYQKFFRYALRPCSSFILCASKLVLGSHCPADSNSLHQQFDGQYSAQSIAHSCGSLSPGLRPFCLRCCSRAFASTGCARGTPPAGLFGLVTGESTFCGASTMLLLSNFCSTSDASSFGVGKASGTDTGSSTTVEVPALLGMLKLGPHGLGLTEGVSANAETVLEAAAGVSMFFANSICLKRANRSGNIFFGIVTVFLAALSCCTHKQHSQSITTGMQQQFLMR